MREMALVNISRTRQKCGRKGKNLRVVGWGTLEELGPVIFTFQGVLRVTCRT